MESIKQLDEQTVRILNSGVIFKKPINVVKELIENSLDAHCNTIRITLIQSGYSQIRVSDNGNGINSPHELCKRFCTSKLRHIDDLAHLSTFGFRGEALSALSHVAALTITSNPLLPEPGAAFTAEYSDGELKSLTPSETKPDSGTIVVVKQLFKKCSSSIRVTMADKARERSEIAEYVSQMSLHYCGCGFILEDDSDILVNTRPIGATSVSATSRADDEYRLILKSIYGRWTNDLLRVDFGISKMVEGFGYIAPLPGGSVKSDFITFVNGRLVKWTNLRRSIRSMYIEASPKVKSIFVYLAVSIPVNLVDYNVDPEKYLFSCKDESLVICEITKVLDRYLHSDSKSLMTRVKSDSRSQQVLTGQQSGIAMIGAVDYGVFVCVKNGVELGILDIRDRLEATITAAMTNKKLIRKIILDPPLKLETIDPKLDISNQEWVVIVRDGYLKNIPCLSLK